MDFIYKLPIVALIIMTFKAFLKTNILFNNPKSTSVFTVLSCASSIIIIEYLFNEESKIASRSNIPSVKNFIRVYLLKIKINENC